jgi:hypothetical protein
MRTLLVVVLLGMSTAYPAARAETKHAPVVVEDQRADKQPIVVAPVNVQPITVNGDITSHASKEDAQAVAKSDREKSANEHSLTNATWFLAWLTVALAIIAIVQIMMFLRQLRITKDALADAKEAADASKIAADAAKESAEALPKIERAYVFVEVIKNKFLQRQGDGRTLFANVRCHNHGKTPAILRVFRGYCLYSDGVPEELIDHPNANREMPEGLVIRSLDSKDFEVTFEMTSEEFQSLHDEHLRVFVVGKIGYDDVIGKYHETGYCWVSKWEATQTIFTIIPSALNNFD